MIELMIAVAITGILAAIAYPAYVTHADKARRSEAQVALFELAQFMERHYTANGTYVLPSGTALPYTEAPRDGSSKYYNLSFKQNPTGSTFVLQAAPKGSMASDKCGTLTLSNTGSKGQAKGATFADCWRR